MRPAPWTHLEQYRVPSKNVKVEHALSTTGDDFGLFEIPHRPTAVVLHVFATPARFAIIGKLGDEYAWDHVSVSLRNRAPNWPEMEFVKRLFFSDDETAMQLHVPTSDHRNLHPYCLHIWKPGLVGIPRPPSELVAVPGTIAENEAHMNTVLAKIGAGKR